MSYLPANLMTFTLTETLEANSEVEQEEQLERLKKFMNRLPAISILTTSGENINNI